MIMTKRLQDMCEIVDIPLPESECHRGVCEKVSKSGLVNSRKFKDFLL